MSPPVVIRPYRPPDDSSFRTLINACYGDKGVSEELFCHWHFGLKGAVQGMMLAEADEGVVGIQPMEIVPHRLAGRPILAGILTGVMVHPAWRRQGVFSRLVRACEERAWGEGASLVWTMPNDRSRPGFLKLGYREPGERGLLVWAPRPARILSTRLPGALAAVLGALAAPVIGRQLRDPGGLSVHEVSDFAEPAGAVAARAMTAWPGLVQERGPQWIEWRFGGPRAESYRRFLGLGTDEVLAAWAVTARETREGLSVGYLVDVMADDEAAFLSVCAGALDRLVADGVDLVMAVVAGRELRCRLRRLGFVPVPRWAAPKRFYTVYRVRPDAPPDMAAALAQFDTWYQTLADWDTI